MAIVSKLEMDSVSEIPVRGSAKALVKGLALVEIVASASPPARLTDLVAASGYPRSSAIRILEALCDMEVLRHCDGGYDLGPRLATWGHAFLERLDLPRVCADVMDGLVAASGETSYLGIRERSYVLYISAAFTPQPVRPSVVAGARNPLHCTGIGKALLSPMTHEQRAALLRPPLERRTAHTIVDPAELNADLDASWERGYTVDDGENEEGVRCVAAPVLDHGGHPVAAVSIAAPAYRFAIADVHRLAPEVLAASAELSARLGHRNDMPAFAHTRSKS